MSPMSWMSLPRRMAAPSNSWRCNSAPIEMAMKSWGKHGEMRFEDFCIGILLYGCSILTHTLFNFKTAIYFLWSKLDPNWAIVQRLWSNKVPMRSGARWAWRTCLRTGPAVWQLGCVTAEPSPIEFNRSEHVNICQCEVGSATVPQELVFIMGRQLPLFGRNHFHLNITTLSTDCWPIKKKTVIFSASRCFGWTPRFFCLKAMSKFHGWR
jgi:hypothetical protein